VGSLDFVADSHTAGAEDAAVVVNGEAIVGQIHAAIGEAVGKAGVVHAHGDRHILQLAVAVGHTDGADVVAFGKNQFHRHAAVFRQSGALGLNHHAFGGLRHAGGQQLVDPRHLH
jgi:hypothetical protein